MIFFVVVVLLVRWSESVAPWQGELLQICALQREQGHDGGRELASPSAQGEAVDAALRWDQGSPCHHIAARHSIQGDCWEATLLE